MFIRSKEVAAEAKKAEGASCTALQIPRPPNLTGREACVQAMSSVVKHMLVMLLTVDVVKKEVYLIHAIMPKNTTIYSWCHQ